MHREIQAKWPTRATLADRFSAIRRIPSNYQRPSVWAIENSLHWVMDVVFRDDDCRLRTDHGPDNFTTIKHIAMNLIRRSKGKGSFKMKRFAATVSDEVLAAVIAA